jgi:signal transduction histidine kinase
MNQPSSAVDSCQVDRLQAEMRKLQAMATLGELTGTATHEFNNILMTIINYARLGMRNQDTASRDRAFSKILEASERAAKITSTVLAQARNRGDSLEPTALAPVIQSSLVLLEREMRKYRVSVETEIDESTPLVMASGNQIQRVLLNLLINARQAMPEGGTVLIRLAKSKQTSKYDEPMVELTVRDSGCGIEPSVLPKIFDAFYSTKNGPDETGKGGTGLGLAACKEIIDEHNGKIRVESTVGRGTAFIIRLPIAKNVKAAA